MKQAINLLSSKYNHIDALTTVALFALVYFAWRSVSVDLAGFGEGVLAIFGGRSAHAWASSQGGNGNGNP